MSTSIIMDTFTNKKSLEKISDICNSIKITDNNKRADAIIKLLKKEGFEEIGCGTNRIVVAVKNRTDYVFKIALDNRGICDNNNEFLLSPYLVPKGWVAASYENTGLILAQEMGVTCTRNEMDTRIDEVLSILDEIKFSFVLNDVGPESYRNWMIDKYGKIKLCDYAYLSPVSEMKITNCSKCDTELEYNDNLSGFVCPKCGKEYSFGTVTGGISVSELYDMGFVSANPIDVNQDGLLDDSELEDCCSDENVELKRLGFTI